MSTLSSGMCLDSNILPVILTLPLQHRAQCQAAGEMVSQAHLLQCHGAEHLG